MFQELHMDEDWIYNLQVTNLNSNIKSYVNMLYENFNDDKNDKLSLEHFCNWASQHPELLSSFEKNFYSNLWGETNSPKAVVLGQGSQQPSLGIKFSAPVLKCYLFFKTSNSGSSRKRYWFELHAKFMIFFNNPQDQAPASNL